MYLGYGLETASLSGVLAGSIALGVAFLVIYIIGSVIYNLYFHPLHNYPGPRFFAATDFATMSRVIRGTQVATLKGLHDVYGPVVRIGPNRLSFNDPAAFKDIYGHRHNKPNMQKDPDVYAKPPGGVPGIIVADDAGHARQRRYMAHAFSAKALEEQQYLIKGYIDMFLKGLKEHAGEEVDMVAWYNWTTFDIIGCLAFGADFECLANRAYHPWIKNLFGSIKALAFISASKAYPTFANLLQKCIPKSVQAKRTAHFKFAQDRAERRMAEETSRKDFMSYILKHNDEKGMSKQEIGVNAGTLTLAGSETTATLLSGTTFYLLKNPSTLQRLTNEIRSAFATEDEIDFKSVSDLRYLIACLDEGLRMYPPVPVGLPRKVPQGGDEILGRYVPEGTSVSVSHWSTYRSESNFKDAQSYIPERWLDDPRFASDKKDALQPFSVGPRNCIGKNLAYVEMRLILARFLWNFDIELPEASKNWITQPVFMLWEKGPLKVKVTPRKVQ